MMPGNVNIREHDDEVIVVADLPAPKEGQRSRQSGALRYLPKKVEKEEKEEGFYVRERIFGSMCRVVPLPHDVTDKEAVTSF
jgi:HSP20 family protein